MSNEQLTPQSFDAFLERFFTKMAMYVGSKNFALAVSFLHGVEHGLKWMTVPAIDHLNGLSEWVDLRKRKHTATSWHIRLTEGATTDEEKCEKLYKALQAFRRDVAEKGVDAIKRKHAERFPHCYHGS